MFAHTLASVCVCVLWVGGWWVVVLFGEVCINYCRNYYLLFLY